MNAITGTVNTAPVMPATYVPPATPSTTATGCSETDEPMISGWRMCPSICCTASTMPNITSAVTTPLSTSATRTATVPVRNAPTIGMKDPTNTSRPRGRASGTVAVLVALVDKGVVTALVMFG